MTDSDDGGIYHSQVCDGEVIRAYDVLHSVCRECNRTFLRRHRVKEGSWKWVLPEKYPQPYHDLAKLQGDSNAA